MMMNHTPWKCNNISARARLARVDMLLEICALQAPQEGQQTERVRLPPVDAALMQDLEQAGSLRWRALLAGGG